MGGVGGEEEEEEEEEEYEDAIEKEKEEEMEMVKEVVVADETRAEARRRWDIRVDEVTTNPPTITVYKCEQKDNTIILYY